VTSKISCDSASPQDKDGIVVNEMVGKRCGYNFFGKNAFFPCNREASHMDFFYPVLIEQKNKFDS